MNPILEEHMESIRGGIAGFARGLGISRQAVHKWDKIPKSRVLEVEALTGISRHDLRPDLYPRRKKKKKKAKR